MESNNPSVVPSMCGSHYGPDPLFDPVESRFNDAVFAPWTDLGAVHLTVESSHLGINDLISTICP